MNGSIGFGAGWWCAKEQVIRYVPADNVLSLQLNAINLCVGSQSSVGWTEYAPSHENRFRWIIFRHKHRHCVNEFDWCISNQSQLFTRQFHSAIGAIYAFGGVKQRCVCYRCWLSSSYTCSTTRKTTEKKPNKTPNEQQQYSSETVSNTKRSNDGKSVTFWHWTGDWWCGSGRKVCWRRYRNPFQSSISISFLFSSDLHKRISNINGLMMHFIDGNWDLIFVHL